MKVSLVFYFIFVVYDEVFFSSFSMPVIKNDHVSLNHYGITSMWMKVIFFSLIILTKIFTKTPKSYLFVVVQLCLAFFFSKFILRSFHAHLFSLLCCIQGGCEAFWEATLGGASPYLIHIVYVLGAIVGLFSFYFQNAIVSHGFMSDDLFHVFHIAPFIATFFFAKNHFKTTVTHQFQFELTAFSVGRCLIFAGAVLALSLIHIINQQFFRVCCLGFLLSKEYAQIAIMIGSAALISSVSHFLVHKKTYFVFILLAATSLIRLITIYGTNCLPVVNGLCWGLSHYFFVITFTMISCDCKIILFIGINAAVRLFVEFAFLPPFKSHEHLIFLSKSFIILVAVIFRDNIRAAITAGKTLVVPPPIYNS